MSITTVSSRDFARDLAQAKRATTAGPVFVTDRGKPTFALLKIEGLLQARRGKAAKSARHYGFAARRPVRVRSAKVGQHGF